LTPIPKYQFILCQQANFSNGSAFVLQGISANQNTTADQESDANFFDEDEDALDALEGVLELSNDQDSNNTSSINTTNSSEGNLIIALEGGASNRGTMSPECKYDILAEGGINGTIVTFALPPGTYDRCSISVSNGNITDTGEIGNLMVVSDSKEDYRNSAATSVTTDEQGAFEASLRVPNIEEGEYAILAVGDGRLASVSGLSVNSTQPVTETEDAFANSTANIINETITQAQENATLTQNQTQNNQTDTNTEATVQIDETSAKPGSPLAISGERFQPSSPIQILINNVQITNVITWKGHLTQ
jgi:hypothetical protein